MTQQLAAIMFYNDSGAGDGSFVPPRGELEFELRWTIFKCREKKN